MSADKTKWNKSYPYFLLPVRKLSADFRDKLLFYLRREEIKKTLTIPKDISDLKSLSDFLKTIKWVVNSQSPKKGKTKPEFIIRYLSRYVKKSVVSDNRICKIENGKVYLEYFDRKRKIKKIECLSEALLTRRLVFHILPKGSMALWQIVTGQVCLYYAGCYWDKRYMNHDDNPFLAAGR